LVLVLVLVLALALVWALARVLALALALALVLAGLACWILTHPRYALALAGAQLKCFPWLQPLSSVGHEEASASCCCCCCCSPLRCMVGNFGMPAQLKIGHGEIFEVFGEIFEVFEFKDTHARSFSMERRTATRAASRRSVATAHTQTWRQSTKRPT